MRTVGDLVDLLAACVRALYSAAISEFWSILVAAAAMSGLLWVAAIYSVRLWNRFYELKRLHKASGLLVAVLTFGGLVVFSSLGYLEDVTRELIHDWSEHIAADQLWGDATFQRAYYAVEELGYEDFSGLIRPENGGSSFPAVHDTSRHVAALVYARDAIAHFKQRHSILSLIVWASEEVVVQTLAESIDVYMHDASSKYSIRRAIELVACVVNEDLGAQAFRVALVSRLSIFAIILILQLALFGSIAISASRELKISV